jgi:glycosyltransferase involved in cell wall biosynthesis
VAKKIKGYDVVISSSSWYVTKGFGAKKEICYCHTPPRWLYGYKTSMNWQKYWPVRVYGQIIGHFMRQYDYWAAQKVTHFVANSEEVRRRIKKFYRRDSTVIYPPANLVVSSKQLVGSKEEDYYLIVSRLVGGKGIELGVKAANKGKFKLKIVGEGPLEIETSKYVELVEQVKDEELAELYAKAKGFLALSRDEDFGITPVEAMSVGTGVVAYNGGGYQETVVDGKTGVLFDDYSVDGLVGAIKRLKKLKIKPKDCINQAKKFSKSRFKREMKKFVKAKALT